MPSVKSRITTDCAATLLIWDSSYSVNIAEIDQQHQMLMSMINELSNNIVQGESRAVLEKILDGLASYSGAHFAAEERLFDKYSYPWSNTHKAEHQAFTQRVTSIIQEYKHEKTGLTHQTLNLWSDWLKNHIISKDKTYSYFLVNKGLK
jgi:hemerythrin